MEHPPKPPMPEPLAALVEACIISARQELTRVGHIQPVAFIGHIGEMKSLIFPLSDTNSKEEAMAFIRYFAALSDADFVFTIREAWIFEPSHGLHYQETIERYGSLENSPDSVESVVFMLETHAGTWCGIAEQKPLNDSQAKTFGDVEMQMLEKGDGRLFGSLPPRDSGQVVH